MTINSINTWITLFLSVAGILGVWLAWYKDKVSKEKSYEHDYASNKQAHELAFKEIDMIKRYHEDSISRMHVRIDNKEEKERKNEILLNRIDERLENLQRTISQMSGYKEDK